MKAEIVKALFFMFVEQSEWAPTEFTQELRRRGITHTDQEIRDTAAGLRINLMKKRGQDPRWIPRDPNRRPRPDPTE
jgi:hypothetical protein